MPFISVNNNPHLHFSVSIVIICLHQVMPSSIPQAAAAVPLKAPAGPKVDLIAWDPDSPEHTERMMQQRVACGWKQELVEKWRVLQREGKTGLQWVVSGVLFFIRQI